VRKSLPVAVILLVELLAAVVSATLLGGESLTANDWAGGALILFAAMLESRRGEEHLEPVIPSVAERV
jgi:drug/metabolite transporter (DMT)-like permease